MPLIKSISGIRGTIGGLQGENLTPIDIVKFTAAYAEILLEKREEKRSRPLVVIGRDARKSGKIVSNLVSNTLNSMGVAVLDIGLSTTPTVEMEVVARKADGGIIITASHNPAQWNALKLLNEKGEFLSAEDGELVLHFAENNFYIFSEMNDLGGCFYENNLIAINRHIDAILKLDLVDIDAIEQADFKVAIDCVNSTGGIVIPRLLKALGVNKIHRLHCKPNGNFPHNPEPLPEHLTDLSNYIKQHRIDVGFAVDPDVDRLAIVQENGEFFGEEYTLVAVADYVLQHTAGNTVSNLSSTQALKVVTEKYNNPLRHCGLDPQSPANNTSPNPSEGGEHSLPIGEGWGGVQTRNEERNHCQHFSAAVGEVNVVEKMKECGAVIGGEGNGGVIYPKLHYGRDALVGIALFLTQLAKSKLTVSQLRATYPDFYISKNKIELPPALDTDALFAAIKEKYKQQPIIDIDGIRIDFENEWVQLRKSNTEPIIRIYAESNSMQKAEELAKRLIDDIQFSMKNNE